MQRCHLLTWRVVMLRKIIVLSSLFFFSFSSSATMVFVEDLVVAPKQNNILQGTAAPFFSILDFGVLEAIPGTSSLLPSFLFPGDETVLGFQSNSVSNSSTSSEVVGPDGTRTRVDQELRASTTRLLQGVDIFSSVGLSGFSDNLLSIRSGALFLDFSNIELFDFSELILTVTFSSETIVEVLSETLNEIQPATQALTENVVSVNSPSSLSLLIALVAILLMVQKRSIMFKVASQVA